MASRLRKKMKEKIDLAKCPKCAYGCKLCINNQSGKCVALTSTLFVDKRGKIKECPFYKFNDNVRCIDFINQNV